MRIMYVDESGDPGRRSHVRHFILSCLILPASDWKDCFERHHQLRRHLKATYGFPVRAELHAAALVDPRYGDADTRALATRKRRMALYQDVMRAVPSVFPTARTFSVFVDKDAAEGTVFQRENYLTIAWNYLINRYHTYLSKECESQPGIVISDDSAEATIRALLRRMRVYNTLPSRYDPRGFYNVPVQTVIEDPFFRKSKHSYFVQIADLIAHSLYRKLRVKGSFRRYNLQSYFDYLSPIVHTAATGKDPLNMGIVRIP
jgi:hypothetical protein